MVRIQSGLKLALITMGLSLLFTMGFAVVTAGILGLIANHKLNQFLQAAEINREEFITTVKTGWSQPVAQTNGYKNVLLLGVDTLATRGDSLPLTDTMMLVSLNTTTGTINTLPLPRDLWSDEYATKINSLYVYGKDRFPEDPERFPKETIEKMTGVPIHHTVVLSMDQVSTIIDLLGGIEVEVKEGFTDPEFPRPDVDVTVERDPAKLYQTVVFEPGKQQMSGERALQYIRSRHSAGDQGTDIARSNRQQQVISSLSTALRQKSTLTNPTLMGTLYGYYQRTFADSFSITEGIATLKTLYPMRNSIAFRSHTLGIYPEDPQGPIEHPSPRLYQNQWVYAIRDPATFQQTVQTVLYGNQ